MAYLSSMVQHRLEQKLQQKLLQQSQQPSLHTLLRISQQGSQQKPYHVALLCLAFVLSFSCNQAISAEPADSTYDIGGASGADPKKFDKWLQAFKKTVQKNDKNAIAKMIDYPLRFNGGSKDYDDYTCARIDSKGKTLTQQTFLKNYDQIFTRSLRHRILNAWKSEYWDRDQGVALASGEIWFNPSNKGANYKIKTINRIPPDIEGTQEKIQSTEKANPVNNEQLANLYSELAQEYDYFCTFLTRLREVERADYKSKAETAYKKAVTLRNGGAKEKSPEQARDLRLLADNLTDQKERTIEAEGYYKKALELQESVLPADAAALNCTIEKLKSIYQDAPLKRTELLKIDLPRQKSVAEAKEKKLGSQPSNKILIEACKNHIQLSKSYAEIGNKADSLASLDKAYKLFQLIKPFDQSFAAEFATAMAEGGKSNEAVSVYNKVTDRETRFYSSKSLVLALARTGKIAASDKLLEDEIAKATELSYGRRLAEYVEAYLLQKKYDKALKLADLAIEKCSGDSGMHVALYNKGKVELAMGHDAKAEDCFSKAIAAFKELYPKDNPDFALRKDFARLLLKEKKWDKANKTIDEMLAAYTHPDTLSASYAELLGMKAQILAHQKSPKAEAMLKSAIEIKTRVLGAGDPSIASLTSQFSKASAK